MGDAAALARLEALVHPLVSAAKRRWLAAQAAAGQPLVVLDIPLLYETGAERECDAVAVVSAPADAQRARALARPGMTAAKLDAILARQVPDADKRRRADFVIDTVRPACGPVCLQPGGLRRETRASICPHSPFTARCHPPAPRHRRASRRRRRGSTWRPWWRGCGGGRAASMQSCWRRRRQARTAAASPLQAPRPHP